MPLLLELLGGFAQDVLGLGDFSYERLHQIALLGTNTNGNRSVVSRSSMVDFLDIH